MKKSNLIKSFAMGLIASSMLITPAFADSCGYWQAYTASSKCERPGFCTIKRQDMGYWTTTTKYKRKCVNKNTNTHYWQYKTKKSEGHTCILK